MISPCFGVCTMDDISKTCKGCYRTIEEIATWSSLTDEQREEITARVLLAAFQNYPERK